ncbi:MAG TPA: ArsB/NhaD family transporter [Geobacteraceae bacterium]|nr:ArsB/NhaD family transporter [Geobacteraceae bacterium]
MPNLHTIAGVLIFLVTLGIVMARPRGISEAAAAAGGAALMLLGGYVRPAEAISLLLKDWNVYGFFLGLMAISALADHAGIFEMLARQACRCARGSGLRLYMAVFFVGVAITAFLSNDATALILTPVVYALVTRLRLPVMPFMFACTFIADTASFVLPVSNPINILVLNSFGGGLSTFLRYLLLPGLFCIGLNIALFVWLFRRDLRIQFDLADLPEVKLPDRRLFHFTAATLILIAVAYVAASATRFPLSIVALGGGGLLLAGAYRYRCLNTARLGREISWPLFVFITGMFIVVRAVENLGLTAAFGRGILQLADGSPLQAVLITALGTALGANLINNVPMALLMISVLGNIPAGSIKHGMVYATIFGADLGPNLTTVGSLATMLWLLILRRKGLDISTLEYFKLGVTVVPVMIVAGSLLIWLKL